MSFVDSTLTTCLVTLAEFRRTFDPLGTQAAVQIGPDVVVSVDKVKKDALAKMANEALVLGAQVLNIRE